MDVRWLKKYEAHRSQLRSRVDIDAYFTQAEFAGHSIVQLPLGRLSFPTGKVIACDPLCGIERQEPYIQKIPPGHYPVSACVVPSSRYGNRYAAIKVEVTKEKPVYYEYGMTGSENLDSLDGDDEYFGFCVDAGMGAIFDRQTQKAYEKYWQARLEQERDIDPFNDLFDDLLIENAEKNPAYQLKRGSWLHWTVPETSNDLVMTQSGWGDGVYPCCFGYDYSGAICAVYVLFIDLTQRD